MSDKRQIQPTGCAVVTVTIDAINGFRGEPRQIPVTLHIRHPNGVCEERVVYCGDQLTITMPPDPTTTVNAGQEGK